MAEAPDNPIAQFQAQRLEYGVVQNIQRENLTVFHEIS